MAELGKINKLKITSKSKNHFVLDGEQYGDLWLKIKDIDFFERTQKNSLIQVFLYKVTDNEVAVTIDKPKAEANQCALLQVVKISEHGAFLDIGLSKDLFVPINQQRKRLRKDSQCLAYIYLDKKTGRLLGSTKLNMHLIEESDELESGEQVRLQIWEKTDLGYKAVINDKFIGLLFKQDAYRSLSFGEKLTGFIKNIREDKKIDLLISKKANTESHYELDKNILNAINVSGGTLNITDKTSPEEIYKKFSVSKKQYKQAIGRLYKKRLIKIESESISLI